MNKILNIPEAFESLSIKYEAHPAFANHRT